MQILACWNLVLGETPFAARPGFSVRGNISTPKFTTFA
jgi:hypothetical protein